MKLVRVASATHNHNKQGKYFRTAAAYNQNMHEMEETRRLRNEQNTFRTNVEASIWTLTLYVHVQKPDQTRESGDRGELTGYERAQ